MKKFQDVKAAYEKIMGTKGEADEADKEWRFRTWRAGDLISQQRTDVAGNMRRRPLRPVTLDKGYGLSLGHPDGSGTDNARKNEFLGDGLDSKRRSSSTVGTGQNKWVTKKELKPWNPNSRPQVRASSVSRNKKAE